MEILNDFNTSVHKALGEIDPKYRDHRGLVICGTHRPVDIDYLLGKIHKARTEGIPFLGICFGHQLAAIEYARSVFGSRGATSEEFYNPADTVVVNGAVVEPELIVRKRPEGLKVGLHEGESWWNNYEVIPGFESIWKKPDHFITVQYHPEYQSSKEKPHPVLVNFLNLCRGNVE